MTNVLIVAEALFPSVRLCGVRQMEVLAERGTVRFEFAGYYRVRAAQLNRADIVIFIRSSSNFEKILAQQALEAGKQLAYVLDDDLFHVPVDFTGKEQYPARLRENMRWFLGNCDVFLTPCRGLPEKYGPLTKHAELIDEPATLSDRRPRKNQEKLTVGFAGSMDRTRDLNSILSGAIDRVMAEYGDRVTFEFFGGKPAIAEKYGFRHIPYTDSYERYCETMASLGWDIALAPMPETEFHRCKYHNKYVEYSGYGIPGIYSDCEPYSRAVRDGETGLLCPNTDEAWAAALRRLLDDAALRERLAAACREEAESRYSPERVAGDYFRVLTAHLSPKVPGEPVRCLRWKKWMYFLRRAAEKLKKA